MQIQKQSFSRVTERHELRPAQKISRSQGSKTVMSAWLILMQSWWWLVQVWWSNTWCSISVGAVMVGKIWKQSHAGVDGRVDAQVVFIRLMDGQADENVETIRLTRSWFEHCDDQLCMYNDDQVGGRLECYERDSDSKVEVEADLVTSGGDGQAVVDVMMVRLLLMWWWSSGCMHVDGLVDGR